MPRYEVRCEDWLTATRCLRCRVTELQGFDPTQLEKIVRGVTHINHPHCSCCSDRNYRTLVYRLGLFGASPHTLKQTAAWLGVTSERIRQIEAKCLRRVRSFITAGSDA